MSIEISHINESDYNEILQQDVAVFDNARGTAAKNLSTISNMANEEE